MLLPDRNHSNSFRLWAGADLPQVRNSQVGCWNLGHGRAPTGPHDEVCRSRHYGWYYCHCKCRALLEWALLTLQYGLVVSVLISGDRKSHLERMHVPYEGTAWLTRQ